MQATVRPMIAEVSENIARFLSAFHVSDKIPHSLPSCTVNYRTRSRHTVDSPLLSIGIPSLSRVKLQSPRVSPNITVTRAGSLAVPFCQYTNQLNRRLCSLASYYPWPCLILPRSFVGLYSSRTPARTDNHSNRHRLHPEAAGDLRAQELERSCGGGVVFRPDYCERGGPSLELGHGLH